MTVDVVIPTYKPDSLFLSLLDKLAGQTLRPARIIIINTEERYFSELMAEEELKGKYDNLVIIHIEENEFDHGGTRMQAIRRSDAPVVMMMTQDAVPVDEYLVERLAARLQENKMAAVAYAKQVATDSSDELERFTRSFNYGDAPQDKTLADLDKLGIKTYFCSNVCAAYNRGILDNLGGFPARAIFNEDMVYAARAIKAGRAVCYEPAAQVFHSHDYRLRQLLRRNFDIGVSHADFAEVFSSLPAEGEGMRLVKSCAWHLLRKGKPHLIFKLLAQSVAKYRGYRLGLRYKSLPSERISRLTANPGYWR